MSPWHDIPLYADLKSKAYVHYVNEIPAGTTAKMEVSTELPNHPIVQDRKKDAPRHYPYPSLVNYGCLPQTWENPNEKDPETLLYGDNDPLDVCEISKIERQSGDVYVVKVLGVLGMIDEGEMDWKIIAINAEDPISKELHDIHDLVHHALYQDMTLRLHRWFRDYKIPDGKPPNEFAFDGQVQNQAFAMKVIQHNHEAWKTLHETKTQ